MPTDHDKLLKQVEEQRAIIESKDAFIEAQELIINAQEEVIDAQEDVIAEHGRHIIQMNDGLVRRDRDIHAAHTRLRDIFESRSWRMIRKIGKAYRAVFPKDKIRTRVFENGYKKIMGLRRRGKGKSGAQGSPLAFTVVDNPKVSIIIPVHNKYTYTFQCLKSIFDTCDGIAYEIIIADDASKDRTRKIEKDIPGVNVARNKTALLFLKNCNNAAKQARGQYIVFLNNDTIVHTDWLKSMLSLIDSDERTGIVGSKLIFEDGSLQEAGGIIWDDASGWNFGRGGDPDFYEYNFVREVDYVSGCSLMIRKSLWDEIGGFDERFVPAYYEDTDLAFEARKRGYSVVYQPESVVTHFEGVSHGTNESEGIKAYQNINKERFYDKWKDILAADHYPGGTRLLRARGRMKDKKILLFVDHYVPEFDRDAGSRSMYEYIKLFQSMNYHAVFMPDNRIYTERYTRIHQQMGVEVLYGDWLFDKWQSWVADNAQDIDLIFLSRPHIAAKYLDFCRQATDAFILYCGCDLHSLREKRQYEITKEPKLLWSMKRWEKIEFRAIEDADCSLYPSIEEKKYIEKIDPGLKVEVYPVYIIREIIKNPYQIAGRKGLMFIGGYSHHPNLDAAFWFAEEILPRIKSRIPDVVMHLYGSKAPDELKELESPNIIVHGFVPDEELQSIYESARMTVIPLRYGAGIKGKVVEAMQFGLPIVTTPIGAEGFNDADGYMQIADEAEGLADMICDLYENETRMKDMVEKGYLYLEKEFSADKAKSVIDSILAEGTER